MLITPAPECQQTPTPPPHPTPAPPGPIIWMMALKIGRANQRMPEGFVGQQHIN